MIVNDPPDAASDVVETENKLAFVPDKVMEMFDVKPDALTDTVFVADSPVYACASQRLMLGVIPVDEPCFMSKEQGVMLSFVTVTVFV